MTDIYKYSDEFELNNVIDRINCLSEEISKEQAKPINERDLDKERELRYAQFIQGLKLSTGNNKIF